MTNHFFIHDDADRSIVEDVYCRDEHRVGEIAICMPEARWIVDAGAHVGSFTRLAKRLWPRARIIAIEPADDNAAYFELNTRGLADVELVRAAIAPAEVGERVALRTPHDFSSASRYVAEVFTEMGPWYAAPDDGPLVAAARLTGILDRHGSPNVDVLKLDCEGAELAALADLHAAGYLPRVNWIVGEWHHRASIPRLVTILEPTHEVEACNTDQHYGPFRARRR